MAPTNAQIRNDEPLRRPMNPAQTPETRQMTTYSTPPILRPRGSVVGALEVREALVARLQPPGRPPGAGEGGRAAGGAAPAGDHVEAPAGRGPADWLGDGHADMVHRAKAWRYGLLENF